MFVQSLGCGDAFGSGGRLNSCFFIRTKTHGILLDCGASVMIALKKQHLSGADVDIILITHLHGDHFGGLPFFICEIIAMGNRKKPLTIIGPAATEERARQALEIFFPGVSVQEDTPVTFLTYVPKQMLEFQSLQITAYEAIHSPATNPHSLRLEIENTVIAYSGDTEWSDTLIDMSMNADLFICEASTWNTPVKHHLSVQTVMAQLHRIHAKRTVLTHLGDEALRHVNDIPLTIATDGMILVDE